MEVGREQAGDGYSYKKATGAVLVGFVFNSGWYSEKLPKGAKLYTT